jgi:uncharacterized protein (DUF2062 family)
MSPKKLSLTLALGVTIGIIPLLGINTFLLVIIALTFRLNQPATQIVNWAMYAFQLVLFVPFLKMGQYLFSGPELPFDLSNIVTLFETSFWDTFNAIWQINLLGVLFWVIIAVPLGLIIYYTSLQFFLKQQRKMKLA